MAEEEPPLAPAEPQRETFLHHEAPSPDEEASSYHDADGHPQAAPDQEKV